MKKLLVLLAVILIGCAQESPAAPTPTTITGLQWSASPDNVDGYFMYCGAATSSYGADNTRIDLGDTLQSPFAAFSLLLTDNSQNYCAITAYWLEGGFQNESAYSNEVNFTMQSGAGVRVVPAAPGLLRVY